MNTASAPCPRAGELPQLDDDALDPRHREQLELHVEHCQSCRSHLQLSATSCRQSLPAELLQPHAPTVTATPAAGTLIAGCRLLKPLGAGAASVVWLATEISTHRDVALKLIPANSARRDDLRSRWQSEVAIAARMQHPNLVRLYRVEETPDYFALVFEYVPGETLAKRLHRELPAPAIAARLVHTLATAVQSMHEQQVLHLDLKPSNILLDYSRGDAWELASPRISDFGISAISAAGDSNSPAQVRLPGCGTPPWTAPEQLLLTPELLTPAADVHGLGSLLYALLTGQPPLPPATEDKLLETVLHQRPASPELLTPNLPPQLISICLRCLEKHPADRYQSASDLAATLDAAIAATRGTLHAARTTRAFRLAATAALTLAIAWSTTILQLPKPPAATNTSQASPPADFLSLLAMPVAALDINSARQLATDAAQHTQQMLTQKSADAAQLVRLGVLLQRAGERMNSSVHATLYLAAAEILHNAEKLLTEAHRLVPEDQRILQELAAVRMCLGNLKIPADRITKDTAPSSLRSQIGALRRCADVAAKMTDQRQQVHWLGRVLDAGRIRILHLKWAGHPKLATEIRREIAASLPAADNPLTKFADLRFRMLLWEPSQICQTASIADQQPDTWIFPDSLRTLQLEAISNFIADTLFSAPSTEPFSTTAAQQCLEKSSQLMDQLGLPSQHLPQILNSELVRPIAAVASEWRVNHQLDQAEQLQQAWLQLCTEAHQLFPDHPEIHLALSEAHLQNWKNLLRRDRDDDAVVALKKSQAAAEAAWQAAPESEIAYRQIADRLQRLERFRSGH
ncbi:MAG: protein kinase domain-containing protein [Planctomycetota bacterium]